MALTDVHGPLSDDTTPGSSVPLRSLIDWTQFANCKGKTRLFFDSFPVFKAQLLMAVHISILISWLR
jgi:hypothetical protein